MKRSPMRAARPVGLGAASLLLAGVAAVVGAPSLKSEPFLFPAAGSAPKDVYTGGANMRTGTRVRTDQGEVRVDATVGATTTSLGRVSAGVDAVFEGNYDRVTLVGVTFPASGLFEVRGPVDGSGTDRLVGQGSDTFPSGGGTVGVYGSDRPMARMLMIGATGGPATFRTNRTGTDLLSVDDGDGSLAVVGSATALFLAATGACAGAYQVQDVSSACGPFQFSAKGTNGDTDSLYADGSFPLQVTLANPGPAMVQLTFLVAGAPQPTTVAVLPGGKPFTATGALTKFEWVYADPDPKEVTTVTVTAARAP